MWCVYFRGGVFLFSKGGKTMNNNMVHITIDGKSIQRSPVQRYWVL